MIGGQAADIDGESLDPQKKMVAYIHRQKTARLFESACLMGAIVADNNTLVDVLATYGRELGCAFQIVDDLLDETSSTDRMGKITGKDNSAGKQTYPRCVGIKESRRLVATHVRQAIEVLDRFGSEADDLRDLARFVLERQG